MATFKRSFQLLTIAACLSTSLFAQKKQFTMAEAVNGMTTTLALQSVKQASWQPGTEKFCQVVTTAGGEAWISRTFPKDKKDKGTVDTILTLDQLNSALFSSQPLKTFPQIKWLDKDYVYFMKGKEIKRGLLTANGITWESWINLPDDADNIVVDRHMFVAYTIKNNLWMSTKENGTQITNETDPHILFGHKVHRDEWGIDRGIFPSPRGSYLAFYRMDETMVQDYPIIRWNETPAKVDIIKYPMAGGPSHEVTVGIFNPGSNEIIYLQTGEPKDQYLTSVTWSPDEKFIYVALLNRDQNHLVLNKYDARTGIKEKTMLEESDPKYVHPEHPLTFVPGDDEQFIWWSDRDGYRHLYLYNIEGKLLKQLTKGKYNVNEIVGFKAGEKQAIIATSEESPLEKNIYLIGLGSNHQERLDKAAGMHNAIACENGKFILDTYSSSGVPKKYEVRATDRNFSQVILDAPNTLENYDRAQVKNITLKVDKNPQLYGKLILPPNFDEKHKYPVIVYLYNGPNVQLIHNSFPESGNLWYEYMAQHGYIVFSMDGRGSANRGVAFEQATFRKLGQVEMEDQMRGVQYLKALPYVDTQRIGVHGWSYGGFMTTSLMLKYPGVFKCAVAGGPVMDWKMYEVMYTERYMDTPQQNPEGYEEANLLTKVKNLKGKLMLIHGTDDNTVVWQQSIDFIKKCVDEGVQVDYFVYPGYEHNVRGKDRVHLMQKITDYFDQNLK
ncbi:MAG: DPP IV N-terminal domain-containing protein [Bacteroidota bacterium]